MTFLRHIRYQITKRFVTDYRHKDTIIQDSSCYHNILIQSSQGTLFPNCSVSPRLSKIESYKAANIKEVQFRLKFCVVAHRYIWLRISHNPDAAAVRTVRRSGRTCRLHWPLGATGCLGARKCHSLGSSRRFVIGPIF